MRTLYVTDLDGTLLRSDERTSTYTNETINRLVEKGMLFSYATARSYVTASKATRGLDAQIPLIVYNGAMVVHNRTGEILLSNFFESDIKTVLDDLIAHDVFPIVYSLQNGVERFSYVPDKCSRGMRDFLSTRRGDRREHPVETVQELYEGDLFYVTCIDGEDKLEPFWHQYSQRYRTVYQRDIYTGEQWLEFLPGSASKAHAIRQLQKRLNCDRLVVFGDGKNDMDMFRLADESYAVANAVEELKQIATAVIGSNDEDSVARWLWENQNKNG